MSDLPTGTVTFLFTDIEGSTTRWEHHPAQMQEALSRHHAIMREAIYLHGGILFEMAGDSFVVAFSTAPPALDTALWAQRALYREEWPPEIGQIKVRMALHTGTAEMRPDGYYAQHTLSRQARLLATGHGGQILLSQTTYELVKNHLPDGVELRDMGELRLKDLLHPEHVFQVVATCPPWSLPADFPPLRSLQSRPGNLPRQGMPFIGRELAVEEVSHRLAQSQIRLLTLLGPGGIGKTRLALQTAEQLLDHFSSGVFFVNLAPITDPDLVIPTIANTLGLRETEEKPISYLLQEYVSGRDLLLVLDNLEQVIEAAPLIADLLRSASRLKILATSRIPLRVQMEHEYPVSPLGLPDMRRSSGATALAQCDAVALFIERAQAAKPSFELTDANAATIAAICLRLEGIPLGLVLAAARLRVLTPQAILSRLQDGGRESSLKLLTGGARDLPIRHQTLRDTIEWSHDLLDEGDKTLYRRISIFRGGFSLEAAEAISSIDIGPSVDSLDGISSLVEKSLAYTVEGFDGEIRYRMLEIISEHALEKLEESGEDKQGRDLHARYFMGLVEEANRHLLGARQAGWLARLEEEHDNLRAALSWSTGRGEQGDASGAQLAMRTAAALASFWHVRGYLSEGRDQLEKALGLVAVWSEVGLDKEEKKTIASTTAAIQHGLGLIFRVRGDFVASRHYYEQALATYREIGDRGSQARLLSRLGVLAHTIGDYEEAHAFQTESLAIAREVGNRFAIAVASHNLGNVARDTGNYELARSLYEEALEIVTEMEEISHISSSLNNLANLALHVGDHSRALDLHRQGLEIRGRLGNKMLIAESLIGIASVEIALDSLERGARLLGCAEGLADSTGGKFDPMERKLYDRALTMLSATLDEGTVKEARQDGRNMSLEDAVQYALHNMNVDLVQ